MNAVVEAHEPSARYLEAAIQPALVQQFELLATAHGAAAQLRELILALAVQGKLVRQDANDEPASALLERIARERTRLAAAGKLRQSKDSTAEDASEPPYSLPQGWAWSRLAAIGVINPRNDAADDVAASFVQMSSIPVAFNVPHATEARPWRDIKSGFTQFAEGDVGVAKITPCFENGKSTVFQNLCNGIGAGTTELHVVRPLCGVAPRYVLLFLKSPCFLREGEATMTGTAGQKRLPRSFFENCPFPLPPLAEQTRIVARVDELMRLCDALEAKGRLEAEQHARLLNTLLGTLTDSTTPEELAAHWQRVAAHFDLLLDRPEAVDALEQTILQLAVRGVLVQGQAGTESANTLLKRIAAERARLPNRTGFKRSQGLAPMAAEELPFDLPKDWQWCRVSELGLTTTGTTPPTGRLEYFGGMTPFIGPGQIDGNGQVSLSDRFLSEMGRHEASIAGSGDILMVCIGGSIGKSALLMREVAFNQQINCLHPLVADPGYIHIAMCSAEFQAAVLRASTGSATPIISRGKWDALPIPLPPLEEQHRIVARVTELRCLCADLRQRLAAQQAVQSHLADALVEQALS